MMNHGTVAAGCFRLWLVGCSRKARQQGLEQNLIRNNSRHRWDFFWWWTWYWSLFSFILLSASERSSIRKRRFVLWDILMKDHCEEQKSNNVRRLKIVCKPYDHNIRIRHNFHIPELMYLIDSYLRRRSFNWSPFKRDNKPTAATYSSPMIFGWPLGASLDMDCNVSTQWPKSGDGNLPMVARFLESED